MVFRHAFILPILISLWFPITFVITYALAVKFGDVRPVFPYISDTGNWTPESCFFGLMLNTGAIIMALIMYIRYRQVKEVFSKLEISDSLKKLNCYLMIMGEVAAFGVIMVGNFQETHMFVLHLLGAGLAFGLGSVYQALQSYLSYKIYPEFGNKNINRARVVCAVISCTTGLITTITGGLGFLQYTGEFQNITRWSKEDGGFHYHLSSAVTEWILALTTMVFLSLFTKEFRLISFTEPLIVTLS